MTVLRSLTRPLPLLLVLLFATVAAVDLIHHLRHPPEPLPDLLQDSPLRFAALEPVIDFRRRPSGAITIGPAPRLVGDGWSGGATTEPWIIGRQAALEVETMRGGYRVLVVECRPSERRDAAPTLEVRVNGSSCGALELGRGWGRYRLQLAEDAVRPGANRIEFTVPAGGGKSGRQLRLRRLGLFLAKDAGIDSLTRRPSASQSPKTDTLVIRASGRLELPLNLDGRADAVRLSCRFVDSGGRCTVVVSRPQGTGAGLEPAIRREVDSRREGPAGVRIPVHGRRGEFLLTIDVDLDQGRGKLVVSSLRLVRETGRPPSTEGDPHR